MVTYSEAKEGRKLGKARPNMLIRHKGTLLEYIRGSMRLCAAATHFSCFLERRERERERERQHASVPFILLALTIGANCRLS